MHSFLSHEITYLNVKSLFVTGLTDSANKRSVHQLANDVSQRANLIDPPSIRHSVNSSEFSLDHHQSRTSEDKTQTTDSHTIKSNLFDRITLPPSGKITIITLLNLNPFFIKNNILNRVVLFYSIDITSLIPVDSNLHLLSKKLSY
ncbi:hypothetical protein Pst134EA_027815 [Puccinia striiformis f. sp. tritici]|uniref:hypothetical protein n=1 Tax=Puccinia striiformis f. sp. tritici TaxID=168172 RepID=UPI00200794DB|nr:hypothetical protein Pst134EA_027815 [Puccinia striiformis f. sp. tritici]KAH9448504.1 hypothetical protein Pst134EA_027815 [Puccinia striiformis f. sp. tritici]